METRYFPFICLVWWMADHPCYLLSEGAGLVPNRGSHLRSDQDIVIGTLSLIGGLSLGSAF